MTLKFESILNIEFISQSVWKLWLWFSFLGCNPNPDPFYKATNQIRIGIQNLHGVSGPSFNVQDPNHYQSWCNLHRIQHKLWYIGIKIIVRTLRRFWFWITLMVWAWIRIFIQGDPDSEGLRITFPFQIQVIGCDTVEFGYMPGITEKLRYW